MSFSVVYLFFSESLSLVHGTWFRAQAILLEEGDAEWGLQRIRPHPESVIRE
jgi:hypothetical protein